MLGGGRHKDSPQIGNGRQRYKFHHLKWPLEKLELKSGTQGLYSSFSEFLWDT